MAEQTEVLVVGGGAAGLMAAGTAAGCGRRTLLVEKNARCARKVLITGKGRCNVTNNCGIPEFIENVATGGRFLYSALSQFSPRDAVAFFEDRGVPLKTERGNRVFPETDRAKDIADCLEAYARESGCRIKTGTAEALLLEDGKAAGVQLAGGEKILAQSVIICTGGLSYPLTGSTGDGYRLAKQAGHTITPPGPSLVPLEACERWCGEMMGLSLRNVAVQAVDRMADGKTVFEGFGEMLFTHFGLSGPLILSASCHLRQMQRGRYQIKIDLKPALDAEQLDKRLQRDFAKYANRDFANALGDLLPAKCIPVVVRLSGIAKDCKVHQIPRESRLRLGALLKNLTVTVKGFRPVDEAIITTGGVSVKEIHPKTMESKLAKGLFFAGEVLDVDAYTGGFNLQIAYATGYAAGMHA